VVASANAVPADDREAMTTIAERAPNSLTYSPWP
jgi:hypothetical protein